MLKAELVAKVLIVIGVVTILAGIISGFVAYDKDVAKAYERSVKVFEKLYDNSYAKEEYLINKGLQQANLTFALSLAIGGFISGILFVGLGTTIRLLISINEKINSNNIMGS
jgi:uncharacterized membrane protein SpoIIM required for sporulation